MSEEEDESVRVGQGVSVRNRCLYTILNYQIMPVKKSVFEEVIIMFLYITIVLITYTVR